MQPRRRDVAAHLLRIAACLLMLAAAAVSLRGRIFGRELLAGAPAAGAPAAVPTRIAVSFPQAAALAVLLLAAVVPLFTKSRRWRNVQLWFDVAVLGLWTGSFLSTARLVGWAGAGLPGGLFEWAQALLLLSMALLYPVFGRPSHYCLHVCPFGAAQELAGRLPVRKWALSPRLVRGLTEFRRTLWAVLMLAAWCSASARWMEWELFGAFAWRAVPPLVVALAAVFLVLAVFTPRPYCRFVCPTGTFLKLAEANRPEPSQPANRPAMKAADYINVLLATALVILCIKLYETREALAEIVARDSPAKSAESVSHAESAENAESENTRHSSLVTRHSEPVVIDSTDLAPGVSGFGGPVPVLVEVKDGVVASVAPKLPNDETPGFFRRLDEAGLWKAWDGLPAEVAATTRVDAVTSATYSSKAAIENVRAALAAATGAESPAAAPVPAANAPVASAFREFDVHADFAENPFTWFTGRGLLLCAGDREKSNAMTIGWGGLGTLWGRNDAVTVYVAEKRHTKSFMDHSARFTVMAFDKSKQANVLEYMGRNSGRDGDKAAALGLHTAYTDDGTPYYEEAQVILECELMYSAPFDPAGMKDVPSKLYANFPAGVHTMYIGRIVKAMKR